MPQPALQLRGDSRRRLQRERYACHVLTLQILARRRVNARVALEHWHDGDIVAAHLAIVGDSDANEGSDSGVARDAAVTDFFNSLDSKYDIVCSPQRHSCNAIVMSVLKQHARQRMLFLLCRSFRRNAPSIVSELMPSALRLLKSRFEDHVLAGLRALDLFGKALAPQDAFGLQDRDSLASEVCFLPPASALMFVATNCSPLLIMFVCK